MAAIIFQSEFNNLLQSWENHNLDPSSRGGTAYEYEVLLALKDDNRVSVDPLAVRSATERSLHYASRLIFSKTDADIFIKTPSVVLFGKRSSKMKNIAIVHHIYLDYKNSSLKGKLSLAILLRRLKQMDCVVTVSEYWQNYFTKIGCRNVKIIYNAFNIEEYRTSQEEIDDFRNKYHLPKDKPLIYLGLDEYGKGVKEVYNALKHYDFNFITTGKNDNKSGIPITKMHLSKQEYILLLHTADLTILMPKIEEGWSRVAHESLLCKTPVIGCGIAGMHELLEKGKQVICLNLEELPTLLEKALSNKQQLAQDGYEYIKQFDLTYFRKEWQSLVNKL